MEQIQNISNLEYVQIKQPDFQKIQVVRIQEIDEFIKLIRLFQPKVIFVVPHDRQKIKSQEFCILENGFAFVTSSFEYFRLEDYYEASESGFTNAKEYYQAIAQEFSDVTQYRTSSKLGYRSFEEFENSGQMGFRGCLVSFREFFKDSDFPLTSTDFTLEAQAYRFAIENGFKSYEELYQAVENGFIDGVEYKEATANGFTLHDDYKSAKDLGIVNRDIYDEYCKLDNVRSNNFLGSIQEALLFQMLDTMEHEDEISVSGLWNVLKNAEADLLVEEITSWYTSSFKDQDEFERFLVSNSISGRLGTSFPNKEIFQRIVLKSVSTATIAIDASNVAYGSGSTEGNEGPKVSNLEVVLHALKGKGFKDLKIFADASLKHNIDNPDQFAVLKNEYNIMEMPAGTDADVFIIKYVIENQCYVISNDRFNDWKEKDSWVRENIDRFRIRFMIIDDLSYFYDEI